ncbi:MAG: threonine--tRNA ligase, partial [Planctomycetes bacterium]|nr:threonine--tRNA ligase [Planctomycetota bacterium]
MPEIKLPDGNSLSFDEAVSVKDIAKRISNGLAKAALAGVVDGEMKDLTFVVANDAEVRIITAKDPEGLKLMRHSAAHVMAEAIAQLFPGTKFAYGPAIEDGFFYDVDSPSPITAEDLPKIEKEMKKIVKQSRPFERCELSRAEAAEKYKNDEYKLDNIERAEGDVISFYSQGNFEDLCRGPHVPNAGKVGVVKIMSLAGAYWHGDETKQQLTRVYGTCFPSQEELDAHLNRIEEAKKRDHRKLGKDLGLFEFHPEAPGMAFWRNNGVILRNELIGFLRGLCVKHGYDEVLTPQILVKDLWLQSGHWANYADKMYITEKDGREYGVKPMNCPGGLILYKAGLYSHNDLPLRWAEFGHVHRFEGSGEIHGLVRVRGFTQDDAHIFCTPTQLQGEIEHCIKMIFEVYGALGMEFDHIELSTRPEKRIGSDEMWDSAEKALEGALKALDINFKLNPGDGAFYGPKIDFHLGDAIGRTWQMGTIQVDFAMPEKFDLHYVDEKSERQRPVMIHRAISGSRERFLGVLVEHYAGDFPLWLAPEQVRVLNITDSQVDYAGKVVQALREKGIRAKADKRGAKIGA